MVSLLLPYPSGCRTGRFLRREKRFFVYIEMDGEEVAAHTNNTGTMLGLLRQGALALLSPAKDPSRRLKWTLEALELPEGEAWAGVNTLVPNRLLNALFSAGLLPWAAEYTMLKREAVNGESRLDGLFTGPGLPPLWVECKNVTLVKEGAAAFPDAVTERGVKHLQSLMRLKAEGHRAAMLYIIQRPDGRYFRPADEIDPAYGKALRQARDAGVEIYPLVVHVKEDGIHYGGPLPVAADL